MPERIVPPIPCSYCGTPFAPTDGQMKAARNGKPAYHSDECRKAGWKKNRSKDPSTELQRRAMACKKWRDKHKETWRAYMKRWRDKNPEKIAEYKKKASEEPAKQRANEYQKKYWRDRVDAGICTTCAKRPAVAGRRACAICLEKQVEYAMTYKTRMLEKGLCTNCGQRPHLPDQPNTKQPVCDICYLKHASALYFGTVTKWVILADKLAAQRYRCAYSGRPIRLGVDASIDHILPIAAHPELIRDPENFQWVTREVNEMKRYHLPDDFLRLVSDIYHHSIASSTGQAFGVDVLQT